MFGIPIQIKYENSICFHRAGILGVNLFLFFSINLILFNCIENSLNIKVAENQIRINLYFFVQFNQVIS